MDFRRDKFRRPSLEHFDDKGAKNLSASTFWLTIILFTLSSTWFFLLAFAGYVFFPSNFETSVDVVSCATQPLSHSCSPFSTDQCDVISVMVILYGLVGFVICLALIVMLCSLYHGYLKTSIKNQRQVPIIRDSSLKMDTLACMKLCTKCESLHCACAVNSSRRVVSCCICPLMCSFLIGSISLFSQVTFGHGTGEIQTCYVLLNETNSSDSDHLDDSDEAFLAIPFAMKFTISSFILHWCLFFSLSLIGCSSTIYHNYIASAPKDGRRMGMDLEDVIKGDESTGSGLHEPDHSDVLPA